jgi:hypothetical protein
VPVWGSKRLNSGRFGEDKARRRRLQDGPYMAGHEYLCTRRPPELLPRKRTWRRNTFGHPRKFSPQWEVMPPQHGLAGFGEPAPWEIDDRAQRTSWRARVSRCDMPPSPHSPAPASSQSHQHHRVLAYGRILATRQPVGRPAQAFLARTPALVPFARGFTNIQANPQNWPLAGNFGWRPVESGD